MNRKICVVTTSRADYYILKSLLFEIQNDREIQLQLIATGMHLSIRHGSTYLAIQQDGFRIDRKIEMLLDTDTDTGAAKSVGVGIVGMTDVLNDLRPDIVVVLGDRYELFVVAIASLMLGVPIAHINGGETTIGAYDDAIRHALTKMSFIHFTATEHYRKRIIQMGERPDRVFTVGSPILDAIEELELYTKAEIEEVLSIKLHDTTALVTYHPVTNEKKSALQHISNVCDAIKDANIHAVFTSSNADPEGNVVNQYIFDFVKQDTEKYTFENNLGNQLYFSCLKHLDLMIGNSSSGIIEAPSFRMPVVNIGNRQEGRIRAANVIDVGNTKEEITIGIEKAKSKSFRLSLDNIINPYRCSSGKSASNAIKEKLKNYPLTNGVLKKVFYDIQFDI